MKYFAQFPTIEYNTLYMKNIMLNAQIIEEVLKKYEVFHEYTIKDGQRADHIARDYYGDPYYTWIVYLSNKIVDPYTQWPLEYEDLLRYIEKKYGVNVNATKNMVSHYIYKGIVNESKEDIARKNWSMSIETYNMKEAEELQGWFPVMVYDKELQANDRKRSIKLISNRYTNQIATELSRVFGN